MERDPNGRELQDAVDAVREEYRRWAEGLAHAGIDEAEHFAGALARLDGITARTDDPERLADEIGALLGETIRFLTEQRQELGPWPALHARLCEPGGREEEDPLANERRARRRLLKRAAYAAPAILGVMLMGGPGQAFGAIGSCCPNACAPCINYPKLQGWARFIQWWQCQIQRNRMGC